MTHIWKCAICQRRRDGVKTGDLLCGMGGKKSKLNAGVANERRQ